MLVSEFCKSLINLEVDEAKKLTKANKWFFRPLPYKESLILPEVKNPKTIICLFNKLNRVTDAFSFDSRITEM